MATSALGEFWREVSGARFDAKVAGVLAAASLFSTTIATGHLAINPHPTLMVLVLFILARMAIWNDRPGVIFKWLPVLALCFIYADLDSRTGITNVVMRLSGVAQKDHLMLAIDRALFFGRTPAQWMDGTILSRPGAMVFWHIWYLVGYFPMVVISLGVVYLKGPGEAFYQARKRLVFLYLVAYLAYGLVPVTGPFRFSGVAFSTPDAGLVAMGYVQRATAAFDCFPSLHAAGSIFFVWVMSPYISRRWRVLAWVNAALVVFTTLATRVHYGADLLAGALYLFAFLKAMDRLEARSLAPRQVIPDLA
jgi:hypothetical protein